VSDSGGIISSPSSLAPGEVSAMSGRSNHSSGGGGGRAIQPDHEFTTFGGGAAVAAIGGSPDWDGSLPPLHCQSCGFDVLRFRGCRWSRHAGYMHFRNFNGHSLDLPKLGQALVACDGAAAYACQCAWQSVGGGGEGKSSEGASAPTPPSRKELNQWGTDPGPEGGAANGSLRWVKQRKQQQQPIQQLGSTGVAAVG
jgi:hypothetical protein